MYDDYLPASKPPTDFSDFVPYSGLPAAPATAATVKPGGKRRGQLSDDDLVRIAAEESADPDLVRAFYGQESSGGTNTKTSEDGARGGFQVIPATYDRMMKGQGSIDDPLDNARAGIRYIAKLQKDFNNDPEKVAVGYFSGEGNVGSDTPFKRDVRDRNGKGTPTSQYVREVGERYRQLKGAKPELPKSDLKSGAETEVGKAAAKQPKKWKEIADDPVYQAFDSDHQEQIRQRYWRDIVSPAINTENLGRARAEFDDFTRPGILRRAKDALASTLNESTRPGIGDPTAEPASFMFDTASPPSDGTAPPAPFDAGIMKNYNPAKTPVDPRSQQTSPVAPISAKGFGDLRDAARVLPQDVLERAAKSDGVIARGVTQAAAENAAEADARKVLNAPAPEPETSLIERVMDRENIRRGAAQQEELAYRIERMVAAGVGEREARHLAPREEWNKHPLVVKSDTDNGRYFRDVLSGAQGSTGGAARFFGMESTADYLDARARLNLPVDNTFLDRLAAGGGSTLSFLIPGLGIYKGFELATMLPKVVQGFGAAGTMAILESGAEAGGVLKDLRAKGFSEEEAQSRANKTFLANLPIITLTDKIAFFNKAGNFFSTLARGGVAEGGQEFSQQVISNYFTDEPLLKGAGEATAIGAIIGGGAAVTTKGLAGEIEPLTQRGKFGKALYEEIDRSQPVFNPDGTLKGFQAPAETPLPQANNAVPPATVPDQGGAVAADDVLGRAEPEIQGAPSTDAPGMRRQRTPLAENVSSEVPVSEPIVNQQQVDTPVDKQTAQVDNAAALTAGTDATPRVDATPSAHALEPLAPPAERSFAIPEADYGKEGVATLPDGRKLPFRYAVVEADAVQTSNDDDLKPNPLYPTERQNRDRDTAVSKSLIENIANKPDVDRLLESPVPDVGAPLVNSQGVVLNNGRVIGLRKGYRSGTSGTRQYRAAIEARANELGIDPQTIAGKENPVVVRIYDAGLDTPDIGIQSNAGGSAKLSATEQADSDARQLGLGDFAPSDSGEINTAANRPFIRRFLAGVPAGERPQLIASDGLLSKQGLERVRNAILAKAYGKSDILQRLAESTDDNIKGVTAGLIKAAPALARMRDAIQSGDLNDLDIARDVALAAEELSRLRANGESVDSVLAQGDWVGRDEGAALIELMGFLEQNGRSPNRIAGLLNAYAEAVAELGNPKQGDLVGGNKIPTTRELLRAEIAKARKPNDNATRPEPASASQTGANPAAETRAEPAVDRPAPAGDRASASATAETPQSRARPPADRGAPEVSGDLQPGRPAAGATGAAGRSEELDRGGAERESAAGPVAEPAAPKLADDDPRLANTFFKPSAADDAALAAFLRSKASRSIVPEPLPPDIFTIALRVAGSYIEAGARRFPAFSKRMAEKFGDIIKPYLKQIYMAVRHAPGFDNSGMNTEAEIELMAFEGEQANIERGIEAIRKVIASKQDVFDAMQRAGLGTISFRYGKPGTPEKDYNDGGGISHIVAKRGEGIAKEMARVIALGNIGELYGPENAKRVNVAHGGHTAVLSLYHYGNKDTWLLTGWKDGAPDASGESDNRQSYAQQPSGSRAVEGAEATETIKRPGEQGKGGNLVAKTLWKTRAAMSGAASSNPAQTPEALGRNLPQDKDNVADKPISGNASGDASRPEKYVTDAPLVTHQSRKGKLLNGVIAKIPVDEAKAIDPFTFKKDGGYFIRDKHIERPQDAAPEAPVRKPAASDDPLVEELRKAKGGNDRVVQAYLEALRGDGIKNIVEARAIYERIAGVKPDGELQKRVDEMVELAVVMRAREIVAAGSDPLAIYRDLVELYGRQPKLGTRTSTSVEMQAYSTPAPLAWVASTLAGIQPGRTVYEPAAGNGMLLIGARPANATVNELDKARAANLRKQGFAVSQDNAVEFSPREKQDVIIANPPFGVVRDGNGDSTRFTTPFYDTTEIDHAIAFRALASMKDGGRAVLIVGGLNKQLQTPDARRDGYNAAAKRKFYYYLYNNYNVTDHFTVAGELYEKQGAGWPVDVIVIEGRGKAALPLPAVTAPTVISDWAALEGKLNEQTKRTDSGTRAASAASERRPAVGDGADRASDGRSGDRGLPAGSKPAAPVGDGSAGKQPAADGLAERQPGQPGESAARGNARGSGAAPDAQPLARLNTEATAASDTQTLYSPLSGKQALGTLVPVNLRDAIKQSLADLESKVGDIDEFVASELGYDVASLGDYFAAEQIDALGLALYSLSNGRGFIIGDQCVSGRTRLYDPLTGLHSPIAELASAGKPVTVLSLTKTGLQPMNASVPFYKGRAPLYRITLDDGRFIEATSGHRFLTSYGWASLDAGLHEGHFLASAEGHPACMPGSFLSAADALHLSRRPQDCLDDYLRDLPLCDEPLLSATGSGQGAPPSPADAPGRSRRQSPADDPEFSTGHSGQHTGWRRVESVAYIGKDEFFDLSVPDAQNYVAEGFINHNTGIGKGRVVAAIIRWAGRNRRTPIFTTEKPNLYVDMYRDLVDINESDIRPLMTNTEENVPLTDDLNLKTPASSRHNAALQQHVNAGTLGEHNMIFTTYNQMQTRKKERTVRMDFLAAFAADGVVIFDESHNAGGNDEGRPKRKKKDGDEGGGGFHTTKSGRAAFARELASLAHAVFYSSATYAKRPSVMDLYFKTDMGLAVGGDISQLAGAIQAGGVPLQQVVATMLTQAGQYIRRERSFKGVDYDTVPTPVDRKAAEIASAVMLQVKVFDDLKATAVKHLDDAIRAHGQTIASDGATGRAGVSSTNFTSIMHNLVDQMLLTLKIDAAATRAITALERGEKPVITVANTMGSFIEEYVDDFHLTPGDAIGLGFNDLLLRYLERSREITIKNVDGSATRRRLQDRELGPEALAQYTRTRKMIDEAAHLRSLPISPIDWLHYRIRQAGFSSGEITGRTHTIEYHGEGQAVYRRRPSSELSIAGRTRTNRGFNDGSINMLVLNQAGATGLSLHASEKFKNQSRRKMIIAQAERNIDTHMQMLGRVHRTGQVVAPGYEQMVADIPAEKRPAAVLSKKMASLNANTTANRDSDFKAKDTPDFINEYGDEVAAQLMADMPEIHRLIGEPLQHNESGDGFETEDAARKVTGRLPMLTVDQQEEIYALLEDGYAEALARAEATGENALEAKTLELDARTLSKDVLFEAKGAAGSPFTEPAYIELADVKRLGKPYTSEQVAGQVAQTLEADAAQGLDALAAIGRQQARERERTVRSESAVYLQDAAADARDAKAIDAITTRLHAQRDNWLILNNHLFVGNKVALTLPDDTRLYGVVTELKRSKSVKNPVAPGAWKATIAVADGARSLSLPMSKLTVTPVDGRIRIESQQRTASGRPIMPLFDEGQTVSRERRHLVTGNLLAGYSRVGRGRIVNFVAHDGELRQGILMPRAFDLADFQDTRPVDLPAASVRSFLERVATGQVVSTDRNVMIVRSGNDYLIKTKRSRSDGGAYFLNPQLRALVGDFVSRGDSMRVEVDAATLERALNVIESMGQSFLTETYKKEAKEIVGERASESRGTAAFDARGFGQRPSQGTPTKPFSRFAKLRGRSSGANEALADAKSLLGLHFDVPIVERGDMLDTTPASYDFKTRKISFNTNLRLSRAQAAQYVAEEILHAVDAVTENRTLSAGAMAFDLAQGSIAKEAINHHRDEGQLTEWLRYPLDYQMTASEIKGELFARLGVLYFGQPELLERHLPKAYEVYHGIFGLVRDNPVSDSFVFGKIWSSPGGPVQAGGQSGTGKIADGRDVEGARNWNSDPELRRLRDTVSKAFGSSRLGTRVQFSRLNTPSEAASLSGSGPVRGGIAVAAAQQAADDFKARFKGAAALDVRVVADVSEIPAGYRPSPFAEGAYHRSGVVYIIAGNINTEARAHAVLLHEVVGHYGLETLLGDKFASVVRDVQRIAHAKRTLTERVGVADPDYATMEAVALDYPELSPAKQAGEVLARMAETGVKPTFLEVLYARIRNGLRALGINLKYTNAELKTFVIDAAKLVRDGRQPRDALGRWTAEPSFSKMETVRFDRVVDAVAEHKPFSSESVNLGETPDVLAALGAERLPLIIAPSDIIKAMRKHNLSAALLKQVPQQLHDPVMVFDSVTHPGALVVLTELRNDKNQPVVAAIHLSKTARHYRVNEIASVYSKERDSQITNWVKQGALRYRQTAKSLDWVQSAGLQLPLEGLTQGSKGRVLTEANIVNYRNDNKASGVSPSIADLPFDADRPVEVIDVDPQGIVDASGNRIDTRDTAAVRQWLLDNLAHSDPVVNEQTGSKVHFTVNRLKDSLKRKGEAQRSGYAKLRRLIESAAFFDREASDRKHLAGQDVYFAAMRIGERLYSVKIKVDVEAATESAAYKEHKAAEIEITPAMNKAQSRGTTFGYREFSRPTRSGVTIRLGVLTGGVKPSGYQNDNKASESRAPVSVTPRDTVGYRQRAKRVLDRIDAALDALGKLPDKDAFLARRYEALGVIAKADKVAGDIGKSFNAAGEKDKQAVYEYLTTRDANPDGIADLKVRSSAVSAKKTINSVGDALVERGLLAEETHEQYRDAYLPRLYLKHLLSEADWKALGTGKKASDMGYLKARKDIPEDVRAVILGEITDPAFLASVAIAKPLRDMALLDWLGSISRNENWVLPKSVMEFDGKRVTPYWLKEEASRLRRQARYYTPENAAKAIALAQRMDDAADPAIDEIHGKYTDYRQIPNTARYGRLRGLFVKTGIYDDIVGGRDTLPEDPGWFQNVFGYGGVGTKVTQLWKMSKVALNPSGQIRNAVSNAVMLQLSGVPLHLVPTRLLQATHEIIDDGQYWKVAKKYGVTASTFSAQELFHIKRDLLDFELKSRKWSPWLRVKKLAAVIMNGASDAYQFMEALSKTAKIIDVMKREGKDEKTAALEAQKWLFDYSLVPKSVRYARNAPIGIPFATFAYKVLPRMLEVAALHPQRFAPWAALLYSMPMIIAWMFDVDYDDVEKLKAALPEWLQSRGHAMILPYKDERGRWQVVDLGYFFPWTQWTEIARETGDGNINEAIKSAGLFSGPITDLIVAIKTGEDPFTQRPIYTKGDPPKQQVVSLMNYLWSMAAPPFLTDRGALGHGVRAYTGETNKYGDPLDTAAQASLRMLGVNLYALEPKQTRAANIKMRQFEITETIRAAKARMQDRSLTPAQRESIKQDYIDEVKKRQTKLKEYVERSKIHPNLEAAH